MSDGPTWAYAGNIPRFYLFRGLSSAFFWLPIWVLFFERRGLSLSQLGTLEAVASILAALIEVPSGALADTWGRRTSLVLGALFQGLAMFAVLAHMLSPLFLLGYFVWNTSRTFFRGASTALLYDSFRADGREAEFPRAAGRQMAIVMATNAVAGLTGSLIGSQDMRLCFALSGVLSIAAAGVALTMREPPRFDTAERVRSSYFKTIREGLRIAARHAEVRYLVACGALFMAFQVPVMFTLLQPYAQDAGVPLWAMGGLVLMNNVTSMAGALLSGRGFARASAQSRLLAIVALIVTSHLLMWFGLSLPAVGLFAVVALAVTYATPLLSAMLNDVIPSSQRATVLSTQSLLATLFVAGLSPLLLTVADRAGAAASVGLAGTLMGATVGPVLLLWRASRL